MSTIILNSLIYVHVKWVTCHHDMALPQVGDGGDSLHIRRVVANTLNKQLGRTGKGWYSSLGIGDCGSCSDYSVWNYTRRQVYLVNLKGMGMK